MQSFNISRACAGKMPIADWLRKAYANFSLVEFRGNKGSKLYIKDFSIQAINSVDAALFTQSLHISGSISKSKWRFSSNEVSNVSEYTTQAE